MVTWVMLGCFSFTEQLFSIVSLLKESHTFDDNVQAFWCKDAFSACCRVGAAII